jgi:hypothetical protein
MGERQILVYSMAYAARGPLAMVLPLPIARGAGEDALSFISLEDCPDFFDHLDRGFYRRPTGDDIEDMMLGGVDVEATLEVHEVGDYEASFVPRPEDFGRLDERYRLPPDVWLQLNTYRDWGFAVFKLKSTAGATVHPMAFSFPRRERGRLFFPTLHVHRRSVDPTARFDHWLYCQPEPAMNWHLRGWSDSDQPAGAFVDCPRAAELLDPGFPCWRMQIKGMQKNADTWLA